MSNEKVNKLIDEIKDLKVSELLETFKGIIVILPGGSLWTQEDDDITPELEKTKFDVILKAAESSKVNIVKLIRQLTGLSLKEAGAEVEIK